MPQPATVARVPALEAQFAERWHVAYSYLSSVPPSEFDVDKSLANQARFDALDEKVVERYEQSLADGDVFPAVVAYRPGRAASAKLVIVDGNHRLVAHTRANLPLAVYEIERGTRRETIVLMTYVLNATHGLPSAEEERIASAVYLIQSGASQESAARELKVPLRLVKKAMAKARSDERAAEAGVNLREWDSLAGSIRNRLLNVSTDEGFAGAAHLAFAAKLDYNEVGELIALLNGSRSAAKQRAILKSETERYAERVQRTAAGVLSSAERRAMTPKARVAMMLGQVLGLPEDFTALAKSYSGEERHETAQRLSDAGERLRKLALTLDPSLS